MARFASLAFALFLAFSTAHAAGDQDRGKDKIKKLFGDATAAAIKSTVRIKSDGRDVAFGLVVGPKGQIVTKGSELRGDLSCELSDGTVYDAKQVGYHKGTDLALLKIDATDLTVVEFTKTPAEIGDWVAVTGLKKDPIAVGVVSVKTRKLYDDQALIENANKGYMGIVLEDAEGIEGVRISQVQPDGAAAKAGLKKGDILVEVAGKKVEKREQLLELMDAYRPNDSIALKFKRDSEEKSLKIKLAGRGNFDMGAFQNNMGGALSGRRTGFPAILQHDTVVRPADCGGPLINLDGKILGLNIARAGRVETWTLPPEVVQSVVKELIEGKNVTKSEEKKPKEAPKSEKPKTKSTAK